MAGINILKSSCGPNPEEQNDSWDPTTVASRKNRAQPRSDKIPPDEATTVRPSKASEESSAY